MMTNTFNAHIAQKDITVPIYSGTAPFEELRTQTKDKKVFVLTDVTLSTQLLPLIRQYLPQKITQILVAQGESAKTLAQAEKVWQHLLDHQADRSSVLICLGGGSVTDVGGFIASLYMRGMKCIYIPTTLLSMVDASIGGKTGVNFGNVKNCIGSFSQPNAIFIYPEFLKSLPERELVSGFAEIIKHGLIADKDYLSNITKIKRQEIFDSDLPQLISRSIEIKHKIIGDDFKETGASRKLLNFGHTFGHAIESYYLKTDTPLLHGEALSLGIIAESRLSQLKHFISGAEFDQITLALSNIGLPTQLPRQEDTKLPNLTDLKEIMAHDKKNSEGKVLFTLLKQLGQGIINQEATESEVENAFAAILLK